MIGAMKYNQECGLCDTKTKVEVNGKLKKTEEYNDVDFMLNSGSKITIAMCSKHTRPKKFTYPAITNKLHKGWQEEVAFGIGNEDWVKNTAPELEIVGV